MAADDHRSHVPSSCPGGGGLVRSRFRRPLGPQQREQSFVGVERQRGHLIEMEVPDVVCIVAGNHAPTRHFASQPDSNRQLGRVVEVRSNE